MPRYILHSGCDLKSKSRASEILRDRHSRMLHFGLHEVGGGLQKRPGKTLFIVVFLRHVKILHGLLSTLWRSLSHGTLVVFSELT